MTDLGRSDHDPPIGERYVAAVESFVEFARTIGNDEWERPSPCTPGWTARDVLSHVSGITDDALAGRIDGVATPAWTSSQVERNRHHSVDHLLRRWLDQYEEFAAAIDAMGEERPPFDCHTHEHDVRCAVGRPGNRGSALIEHGVRRLTAGLVTVPVSLTVDLAGGRTMTSGAGGPEVAVSGLTPFELFRSRMGRRSRAQVEAYEWSGREDAVAATIDGWFTFGPSELDIDEG